MNILIILSLDIFCHITHPKVYWVRKQCLLFLMGLWLDWLMWAFLTWRFLCGCSPVAAGARGIWAGWMSAWFLSSWLASGLGCREQLGSSWASLPLFPIPSFLTPTLCFSKILPLEASLVAQRIKNLPAMWDTQVWPLGWEWQPTPVFLLGKSCGSMSLLGCNSWGCSKSDTTVRPTLWFFSPTLFKSSGKSLSLLPSSPYFNSFHINLPLHYPGSMCPLFPAWTLTQPLGELVSLLGTIFVLQGTVRNVWTGRGQSPMKGVCCSYLVSKGQGCC